MATELEITLTFSMTKEQWAKLLEAVEAYNDEGVDEGLKSRSLSIAESILDKAIRVME